METQTSEADERSLTSSSLVKSVAVGAVVAAIGIVLYRWLFRSHTIPPIIIKSIDDEHEPIEIESETALVETTSLHSQAESSHLAARRYRMPGFGLTRYVEVYFRNTATGQWKRKWYKKNSGLIVNIWLQHKRGGQWHEEPNGPHLVVTGNMPDSPLTSEQLSRDKPNSGNPNRPRKRSYNKNKNWRIGKVQVGSDAPLPTDGYNDITIEFDNHFH